MAAFLRDQIFQRGAIPAQRLTHILFEIREHCSVGDNAVLDHLGEAAAEFAVGQRPQYSRIGEDQPRRIKRADQVFALRVN